MTKDDSLNGPDTQEKEVVKEMLSHDLEYKAVILRVPDSEQFEVDVYRWKEEKENNSLETIVWKRAAGPFVVDDQKQAESVASENLHLLSGEVIDVSVDEKMQLWLREYSDDYAAEFLSPSGFTARTVVKETVEDTEYKDLKITKVVVVHDLYVVQVEDTNWMNGISEGGNLLTCWGNFDSLASALDEIKQSFLEEDKE